LTPAFIGVIGIPPMCWKSILSTRKKPPKCKWSISNRSIVLVDEFLRRVTRQKRGVGMFLPTRAGTELAAQEVSTRSPKVNAAYIIGGEPVSVIRPFLEEEGATKPYLWP
jgi:hypothetical protein